MFRNCFRSSQFDHKCFFRLSSWWDWCTTKDSLLLYGGIPPSPSSSLPSSRSRLFSERDRVTIAFLLIFWMKTSTEARPKERKKELYQWKGRFQVGFTILFNLECLVKIVCYGWRGYIRRGIFKFEFILAVGSSLNCIYPFYEKNYFT